MVRRDSELVERPGHFRPNFGGISLEELGAQLVDSAVHGVVTIREGLCSSIDVHHVADQAL